MGVLETHILDKVHLPVNIKTCFVDGSVVGDSRRSVCRGECDWWSVDEKPTLPGIDAVKLPV